MSSTDIAELRDTTVDSASPGQTFLNFFGEGGRADSAEDTDGRELCQERESFGAWCDVERPPANDTFSADEITEYVMHRLGGDDVVASASKNREVESQVRTVLGADLVPGDVVRFTGDGTNHAYTHHDPAGNINHVASGGTVNIGADTYVLIRADQVIAYFNTALTGLIALLNNHNHTLVQPGVGISGPPAQLAPPAPSAIFSDLPTAGATDVQSDTGRCD